MWSYGDPNNPLPTDPRFVDRRSAIDAAVEVSKKNDDVLAVFEDDSGECTDLVWTMWVYSA